MSVDNKDEETSNTLTMIWSFLVVHLFVFFGF